MKSIRRSILSTLVPVVAVIGILAIIVWGVIDLSTPFNNARFSVERWKKSEYEARGSMCGDLIRNHIPAGTAQDRVTSLLGSPDDVLTGEDWGGNKMRGVETYSYDIGSFSWQGFDDAFLYVHFDESGEVIAAEVNGY